ncbi:MAG: ABC transporter ATP-binding protein [Clostridia bacterium]|nr:ABC transporter ATP-binding protein [Clostridia bacterium]
MELKVRNVNKKYGRNVILDGVSFDAVSGECVGLIGGNGSGKSTLLGILAGVTRAESAEFLCDGEDLLKNPKKRASVVGYVPQGVPLFDELSARDNLLLWYGRKKMEEELEDGVLGLLGIGEFLRVKVGSMSGGMKKRLAIGCAVYNDPKILLLDEPSAALDLICKEKILSYLKNFTDNGGVATHDVGEIEFCDRLLVLKDRQLSPVEYGGSVSELVSAL